MVSQCEQEWHVSKRIWNFENFENTLHLFVGENNLDLLVVVVAMHTYRTYMLGERSDIGVRPDIYVLDGGDDIGVLPDIYVLDGGDDNGVRPDIYAVGGGDDIKRRLGGGGERPS